MKIQLFYQYLDISGVGSVDDCENHSLYHDEILEGISTCGTSPGSSVLIYQKVMTDGRPTTPPHKRQAMVRKVFQSEPQRCGSLGSLFSVNI